MAKFTLELRGDAPLIMHNAQLSDPLNPASKYLAEITSKRKKSEEDHIEASRREFIGSLYISDPLGPYIPGTVIEACLFRGATKTKMGTTLKPALIIHEEVNPLIYQGPRTADELWLDKSFVHRASVKVGTSRVMRTRPVFASWEVSVTGELDTETVDPDDFEGIVATAGRMAGVGDWRPRHGRFSLVSAVWE